MSDGRHEATTSVTVRQESKVLQSVYSSISEMSSSGSDEVERDMDGENTQSSSAVSRSISTVPSKRQSR